MLKILLILLYPLLILGRVCNALLGRDPLRLREPEGSCWIERPTSELDRATYFSEASEQEGYQHGGCGGTAKAALSLVAKVVAPPRQPEDKEFRSAAERDQDIPDEVYTLW